MHPIAFVSYRNAQDTLLESDDYQHLKAQAQLLEQHNLTLHLVSWEDESVRWQDYRTILPLAVWNYHHPEKTEAFRGWLEQLESLPLLNPPAMIRWNLNKRYLGELAAADITTVPTRYLKPGEGHRVAEVMAETGWAEAILKPTVGASAFGVHKVTAENTTLPAGLEQQTLMLQPFVHEVTTGGEWSLVFFRDGDSLNFSHAVRKLPKSGDYRVQSGSNTLETPPAALIRAAARAVAAGERLSGEQILYARVDGIEVNGQFWLMELELLEPSLFLYLAPLEATAAFLKAITTRGEVALQRQ